MSRKKSSEVAWDGSLILQEPQPEPQPESQPEPEPEPEPQPEPELPIPASLQRAPVATAIEVDGDGVRVGGDIRRILSDPMVQLLVLLGRSNPRGEVHIRDPQLLVYPIVRRPPLGDMLRKIELLQRYGIVRYRRDPDGSINIYVTANLHLPVDEAVAHD